ncbi:MAG TPA: MaoC family dehydratase [Salinisphaeraceae bacterium]|nr:MaoC family dehydratase [Salinisphaeraceae bacterium]
MSKLYWEDFAVGDERHYGQHRVAEEEMLAFACKFDPEPLYADVEAAAAGPYGGLIASGWQVAGWCMRIMVDNLLLQAASLGSPGVESLRWGEPVRAGDVLHVRGTVLDSRASQSRPHMGLVRSRFEVLNQHDAKVMDMVSLVMFQRRPSDADGAAPAGAQA